MSVSPIPESPVVSLLPLERSLQRVVLDGVQGFAQRACEALAQTPGRHVEAIAEYEAALRIRPDPEIRQMLNTLRAQRQPATPAR